MIRTPGAEVSGEQTYTLIVQEEDKQLPILVCDLEHIQSLRHRPRSEIQFLGVYILDLQSHDS